MDKFAIRLHGDQILFRYARGIHELGEREIHTQHELFFLLEGETEFISEMGHKRLTPGTLVLVPKDTFHQFIVLGDESRYTRCVCKFGAIEDLNELICQKLQRVRFIHNGEIPDLFAKLQNLCVSRKSQLETSVLLKAYLAQILVHVNDSSAEPVSCDLFLSPITEKAIQHVRDHIGECLPLESIANFLHVSTSHLSHQFKADMQISLHKYILNKRLILANQMILHSILPIQAAEECGFRDYSNFFVQYKKHFGYPPSRSKAVFKQSKNTEK